LDRQSLTIFPRGIAFAIWQPQRFANSNDWQADDLATATISSKCRAIAGSSGIAYNPPQFEFGSLRIRHRALRHAL
jgi:hypothetical protein